MIEAISANFSVVNEVFWIVMETIGLFHFTGFVFNKLVGN